MKGNPLLLKERRTWRLTPTDAALQDFLARLHPKRLRYQAVAAPAAYDRILAEDVISDRIVPLLPRASVDGYAVMSEATVEASSSNPMLMKVMGHIVLGDDNASLNLQSGETTYVACGASLPSWTDAVVRLEEVRYIDGMIGLIRPVAKGENVDQPGQDLRIGETVLCAGHVLRPQDVAMLVALAKKKVKVVRRPRVAIIPVGSELIDVSEERANGAIEKNSLIISGLLHDLFAKPVRSKIVRDDTDEIASAISKAANVADITITMGGCSVGVKDLVPEAVNSLGPPGVVIHGMSVFPGKPTGLAIIHDKPLIMLPGRVTSALAGFYLLVIPVLSSLVGIDLASRLPKIKAKSRYVIRAKGATSRFEILRIESGPSGCEAEPLPKGVDILSNLLKSNGYIVIPPSTEVQEGQEVEVRLFSPREMAQIQS